MCNSLWDSPLQDMGPGAISRLVLPPALPRIRRAVDGTPTSSPPRRWIRDACHRVWGVENVLGMVREGGFLPCPGSRRDFPPLQGLIYGGPVVV